MRNNRGQSTIEFLVTFIFVFGFVFVFLNISFLYTNGFLVHYATYMSSRAYLVFDNNSKEKDGSDAGAERIAREVLNKFDLEKFIPAIDNVNRSTKIFHPDSGINNLYVGIRFEYQDYLPLPMFTKLEDPIIFVSESFLGREPTRSECLERICSAFNLIDGVDNCEVNSTFSDNGC